MLTQRGHHRAAPTSAEGPSKRRGDIERALAFYSHVGFREVGRVAVGDETTLVMLCLPDDDLVTLELVCVRGVASYELGNGFSHIAVQVDDLVATLARLAERGIDCQPPQFPAGEAGPRTSFIHDPDGYRIELVQWPPGRAAGITRADFAQQGDE